MIFPPFELLGETNTHHFSDECQLLACPFPIFLFIFVIVFKLVSLKCIGMEYFHDYI